MENEPENTTPMPDGAPATPHLGDAGRPQQPSGGAPRGLMIAVAIAVVVVLALQVFTLLSTSRTHDQVTALDDRITTLDDQIATVGSDVAATQSAISDVGAKVEDLAQQSLTSPVASGASAVETPAEPTGDLPLFEQGQPDAALGVRLGDVSGLEYYTNTDLTFDPADGTPRAWLIWAHWCPHCQRELPAVTDWYTENAGDYPDVELVSITSSIDPDRGNPLEPYLDELQTPFPILVDSDSSLAQQFGVNAFPFWVFTAGDGTTVLRVAGYLEVDQVADIFAQLQDLSS